MDYFESILPCMFIWLIDFQDGEKETPINQRNITILMGHGPKVTRFANLVDWPKKKSTIFFITRYLV